MRVCDYYNSDRGDCDHAIFDCEQEQEVLCLLHTWREPSLSSVMGHRMKPESENPDVPPKQGKKRERVITPSSRNKVGRPI